MLGLEQRWGMIRQRKGHEQRPGCLPPSRTPPRNQRPEPGRPKEKRNMKAGIGIKLSVGAILAGVAAFGIAAPGSAQAKPSVVIMPSQFFSANSESADNLTKGIAQQFESQGYSVVG